MHYPPLPFFGSFKEWRCLRYEKRLRNLPVVAGIAAVAVISLATMANLANQSLHNECMALTRDVNGAGAYKYRIDAPGKYCLMEDVKARVGIPGTHHAPESAQILIKSANVELDLRGHQLVGRDWPGLSGIMIDDGLTNVVVRNGVIRDFETGLLRTVDESSQFERGGGAIIRRAHRYQEAPVAIPLGWEFSKQKIKIENVRFANCKVPIVVNDVTYSNNDNGEKN